MLTKEVATTQASQYGKYVIPQWHTTAVHLFLKAGTSI